MKKSIIRCGLIVACILAGCGGEERVEGVEEGGRVDEPDEPVTAMHVPEEHDSFSIPFHYHGLTSQRLDASPRTEDSNAGRRPIRVRVPRPRHGAQSLSTLPRPKFNKLDLGKRRGNHFVGLGNDFGTSFNTIHSHPAPSGDVDSRYYVQLVNDTIAVFDKTRGTSSARVVPAHRLWAGSTFNPCSTATLTDGTVRYDALGERWIVTFRATVNGSTGTRQEPRVALGAIESASTVRQTSEVTAAIAVRDRYFQCVAVSETRDPAGLYHRYIAGFGEELVNANPKLSVWADGYYLTTTLSSVDANGALHPRRARICAMERAAMLAGHAARILCFDLKAHVMHYQDLLAADLDVEKMPGATPPPGTPPSGSPLYVFSLRQKRPGHPSSSGTYDFFNRIGAWKVLMNWNDLARSRLTGPYELRVDPFQMDFEVVQKESNVALDPLEYKLVGRAPYRNFVTHQAVLLTHAVNTPTDSGSGSGSGSGLRWYEIRLPTNPNDWPDMEPEQQGTYAPPDENYRWLGSIAFDKTGNIALAYTVSGENVHPSHRYTGRTTSCSATTPRVTKGTMARREKELLKGGASQDLARHERSLGISTWGTSSTLNVDPDGCTFWYTAAYRGQGDTGENLWSTYVSSFQLPGCVSGESQSIECDPYP